MSGDPRFTRLRDEIRQREELAVEPEEQPPVRRRRFRIIASLVVFGILFLMLVPMGRDFRKSLFRGFTRADSVSAKSVSTAAKAPAARVQINIVNASGANKIGARVTTFLRENGMDVTACETASAEEEKSSVLDRMGNHASSTDVARLLGIANTNVRVARDSSLYVACTVIIGKDYLGLVPFVR